MTTVAPLSDFPDRLSPMVVKELRQGLRTRTFGGVMLVLHLLLILITLMVGAGPKGQDARGLMDGLVSFVLCFVFPLSAFSALAGEIKANTMDMLVLTRLSAGRIVLGKWAAVAGLSLLVTVSILPYYVARYLFGGSELLSDLTTLGGQWLLSATLTAAVVAISTQKHFWLRALIVLAPLMLMFVGSAITFTISAMSSRYSSTPGTSGPVSLSMLNWVAGSAWLIFALLSFAATRIAPAASLLAVTKRLVNLGALILLSALAWFTGGAMALQATFTSVMIVASVDALTEGNRGLPSLYLPFFRRSWWGRLGALFLVPGAAHGFFYSLLLVGLGVGITGALNDWQAAGSLWLTGCAVWFCAFLAQLLSLGRAQDYLGGILAGAFVQYLLSMLIWLLVGVSSRKDEIQWLACLLPMPAFTHSLPSGQMDLFVIGLVINSVWPLLLAVFAFLSFRQTRAARLEARRLAA